MFPKRSTYRRCGLALAVLCVLVLSLSLYAIPPARAAFPGANGLIAFVSDRDGNYEIYTMNADGSNQTNITNNPGNDYVPTWSPDGTQIVFSSDRDGDVEIFVMNADGTNPVQLTFNTAADSSPCWSPDASRIVFTSTRTGNSEIFVMEADGSGQTNLTNHGHTDYFPSWSPDGTKIAFSSTRSGNDEIYLMNTNGTGQTPITHNPQWEYDPIWSPDGAYIAFAGSPFGNHEIYVMKSDGTAQMNVSNNTAAEQGPAWSPDGTQLAFMSMRDGDREVYIMPIGPLAPAEAGDPINLTNNTAGDMDPEWQPVHPSPEPLIYVSATAAGTTGDGLDYGPHDILLWDGEVWAKWFDGTAAGLAPTGKWKHDINAIYIPTDPEGDLVVSFTHNARFVPGIPGKVNGMDLVRWDGEAWSLWFDGEDVGLRILTNEKIDALHVLSAPLAPNNDVCLAYLLLSTQGAGRVPAPGGVGQIAFGGEDILGFCLTSAGAETAGLWEVVLDGSSEGMPRNSLTGLSVSTDGQTFYLTTRGTFDVDAATGGHSMIYTFDRSTLEFAGPIWRASDVGLPGTVDALHFAEALP